MRRADSVSDVATPSAADHIDQLCDLFEAELKSGRRPDLSQVLEKVPGDLRESLLSELLLVALEYAGTSANLVDWSDPALSASPSPAATLNEPDQPQAKDVSAALSQTAESVNDATTRLEISTVVAQSIDGYEILGELGRGGMGVVYRARQISLDRQVALKILQASRINTGDEAHRAHLLQRFDTEVKAASRLDEKTIATVYDTGQYGDSPYYAMRLVEGPSLGKLVQEGPLLPERAARYLARIARTIAKLHATGVVHRDLKPSNILIEQADDTPVVTDFGLAKLVDAEHHVTLSDEGFGSPPYMAPEQVLHATSVTGAADIYSLGATLYHLLTGRPPFQAATPAEIARQIIFCEPVAPRQLSAAIPRDLETICLKCLEKDEHRRYATANDLANDLQCFLDKRPIVARPIGSVARVWRWCRRNRAWTGLIACAVVLLAITIVTAAVTYVREQLAAAAAQRADADKRLNLSDTFFGRSQFVLGQNPHESLPWLMACLKLDANTPREFAARQRIQSVLSHGPVLKRIVWDHGRALCASFHPAGDRVLAGYSNTTAKIWSVETGQCVHTLRHENIVHQAVFSHHGRLAATATDDGLVSLWQVETGQQHGAALVHPGPVMFLAFSADEESLVTSSSDGFVCIWNTRDGSLRTKIMADSSGEPVSCLAISPDGTYGVSSASNSRALVWSLTGEVSPFALEHTDDVTHVEFSPSAGAIVTAAGGEAKIWDVHSGRLLFELSHARAVKQASFTPDGKHVVTVTDEGATVWPLGAAQHASWTIPHEGLRAVQVDPSGVTMVTIGDHGSARLWRLSNGKAVEMPFSPGCEVNDAHFSHDGTSLVTASSDGTARIWNLTDGLRKYDLAGFESGSISTAAGGQSIVAWDGKGAIQVVRGTEPVAAPETLTHDRAITVACVSPDGRRIAAADDRGGLIVWDRETGRALTHRAHHDQPVHVIAFAHDNQMVALGDVAGHVTLNNVDTGDLLKSFDLAGAVFDLAFSPRGDVLLAADAKAARLIRLDAKDAVEAAPVSLGGDIRGVRFSLSGTTAAIFGAANRVLVWNLFSGSLKSLRTGAPVNDVCYANNSATLLTVAQDGTAQIWSTADGAPLRMPIRHGEPLVRGCFSPDGQSMALCDDSGTARIWHIETGQPTTIRVNHADSITHAQFVAPDKLLTITRHGEVRVIDTSPTAVGIDELETISLVRCGQRVDELGKLQRISPADFVRHLRQFGARPAQ